jgi:hypothetical protein
VKVVLPCENLEDIGLDDQDDDPKPTTDFNESEYLKEKLARFESVVEELRSKLNHVADQRCVIEIFVYISITITIGLLKKSPITITITIGCKLC